MLKFTKINKENPSKVSAKERVKSFDEIYAKYASQKAEEQASRCSQCGVPSAKFIVLYTIIFQIG